MVVMSAKVFRHLAIFNGIYGGFLQSVCKIHQVVVAVQLSPLSQRTGPGKNGGHRVGGGLFSL